MVYLISRIVPIMSKSSGAQWRKRSRSRQAERTEVVHVQRFMNLVPVVMLCHAVRQTHWKPDMVSWEPVAWTAWGGEEDEGSCSEEDWGRCVTFVLLNMALLYHDDDHDNHGVMIFAMIYVMMTTMRTMTTMLIGSWRLLLLYYILLFERCWTRSACALGPSLS